MSLPHEIFIYTRHCSYIYSLSHGILFLSTFFGNTHSYLILRHNIYYVYGTQYEGMGKIWPWLMWTIILITIICQITLIGIFYGRKSPMQALLTWPFIFLILIFYIIEQRKHTATFNTLSMQELKKSENIETKKLEVICTSRGYAWLVGHTMPNDRAIKRGISINIPTAAHIYLHPVILRHRLGQMILINEIKEELDYKQIQQYNNMNDLSPVAMFGNVLTVRNF